ncbi:uncharacterized protein L3040_009546 [Drepanopeziza brunnea f. sp. 'multigermtubi']|uniref:Blumeria specific protein n=1 Tax=Marssonina brunnea f. sp. multigermtubi (strain MB_m1) TaxID=1072389 RepID=K1XU97_MARBU|nr:uncharacterized protein MBM_05508 [Drepanopeziza brunnea f. sp. 'multigermtubi' MB_m1]EKD16214.1 hypothetical protein MBM_05508 [Drepanopeziza brunnea f. sp. 'multigermtubi' MB_m1]KAJ5032960.1 hypothetical protein L3040_009546 [Drepanopeziza brunnea f. sp. 'multigermtubi']
MGDERYRNNAPSYRPSSARPQDVRADRYPGRQDSRYEGEKRVELGYDSYKPGQSPSRDLIPPPNRNRCSPFPAEVSSPYNDSQRPNSNHSRSPSESSPYRQPESDAARPPIKPNVHLDQRITSNSTSIKPMLQIKGLASQQNHDTFSSLKNTVSARASSWAAQTRNVSITDSETNKQSSQQPASMPSETADLMGLQAPLIKILRDAFTQAVDDVTEMAALKLKKRTAKVARDKMKAVYEKTKVNHDKYPPMREMQTSAKDEAEKAYQAACQQVDLKAASLVKLAAHTAEHIVPTVLANTPGGQKQQKAEERMNTLESICQNFENFVKEQEKFLAGQQKVNQELERKYSASVQARLDAEKRWANEKSGLQAQLHQIATKLNGLDEAIKPVENLHHKVALVEKDMVRMIPANLTQRLQILDQLPADIKKLYNLADLGSQSFQALDRKLESQKQSSSALNTMSEDHATQTERLQGERDSFTNSLLGLDGRVLELEAAVKAMPDIAAVEDRISRLTAHLRSNSGSENPTGPSFSATSTPASDLRASIDDLTSRLLQTDQRLQTLDSETIKEISGMKKILPEEISKLENKLTQALKSESEMLVELSGVGVERVVKEEFAGSLHRLATVEGSIESLKDFQNTLKESVDSTKGEHDLLKTSHEGLRGEHDTLKSEHDLLKGSHHHIMESQNAMRNKLEAFQIRVGQGLNNLTGATAGHAIKIIQQQNMFAPSSLEESLKTSLATATDTLNTTIEAHQHAIGDLESRFNNIMTSDLHRAIMQSMHEQYPNIKDTQMILSNLGSDINTLKTNLSTIKLAIQEMKESGQAPAQLSVPAEQDNAVMKGCRKEIDSLTIETHNLKKSLNEKLNQLAKSIVDEGDMVEAKSEEKRKELEIKYEEKWKGLYDSIIKLQSKTQEIEKKVSRMSTPQPRTQDQPQPAALRTASGTPSISRATFKPLSRLPSNTSTASIASDSAVLGKRKVITPNGSSAAGVEGSKTNGSKHGDLRSTNSPVQQNQPKRRRRASTKFGDDREKDQSNETDDDDAAEPTVSADEDIDEDARGTPKDVKPVFVKKSQQANQPALAKGLMGKGSGDVITIEDSEDSD